ncbi:unnamed protein product [Hapterophycus canaliculatus]
MSGRAPLASREHVLNIYRQLLTLSKRLPTAQQRDDAVQGVRESFRASTKVTDPSKVNELLRQAESRLGFLKMATPRGKVGSKGSTRAVYRDGKVMEGEEARKHDKARHSNWDGRNLDPDSVRFHKQNLARAGFANHQQVIGPHGF